MKKTNKQYNKHNSAFTIVELLIVIVVIAILAAITVVAYNGIQTRAYNVAVISQAKQVVDLVNAYVAVEGKYPVASANPIDLCAARDNQCTTSSTGEIISTSNTSLINSLSTIGTPPASRVSGDANGRYGVRYLYSLSRTWDDDTQPVVVIYNLKGVGQACNLSNITNSSQNNPTATGYTDTYDNITICIVHIDGPTS